MKLMDAVKMYGLDKNKEENAAGAFSSSASDGADTVGTVYAGSALSDRMEKYRTIRAGELESRLGSWEKSYNNFVSEYASGKKSTQEIRDAWDIVKADGESLSSEIKSTSVFAKSDADRVSDKINGYISSFDEQLKIPERDIGSLGGLDTEYDIADEARKAAARSMATGATGDEAADAKEVLDFTSAPKFSQVGTHQTAVIGDDNYAAEKKDNAVSVIAKGLYGAAQGIAGINNLPEVKTYEPASEKKETLFDNSLTDRLDNAAIKGKDLALINGPFLNGANRFLASAGDSGIGELSKLSGVAQGIAGTNSLPEVKPYEPASEKKETLFDNSLTDILNDSVMKGENAKNDYLLSDNNLMAKQEDSFLNRYLQEKRESGELNTFERVAVDLSETIGYQMPHQLLTMATGATGLAAKLLTAVDFGIASYASTKREALKEGRNDAESEVYARVIGVIEGAGEAVLGDAFGEAPMLANKLGISIVSNIQNPIVRTMLTFLSESVEEGAEEVVQSVLSEGWKSFVFGEDFTLDGKEVMYEGILGALSGGLMGSIGLKQRIDAAGRVHAADVDYINTLSVNADTIDNARDAQLALRALERQRAALGQISDDGAGVRSAEERAEYMDGMMHEIEVQLAERFSLEDDITAAGAFKKNKNGIGLKRSVAQGMTVQGTDDNRVMDFEARAAAVTDADGAAQVIYEIEKYRAERADYSENYETDAQREKYARYDSRLAGIAEELRDRFGVEGTDIAPAGEATMQGVTSKEELDKAFSPEARTARASGEELETASQSYSAPDTEDARFVMQTGKENGATPGAIAAAQELSRILGRRIGFYSSDPEDNGYYERANNRIMVNAASGRTVPSIVASEMTHALELTEQYGELKKIALENLPKAKGETLEALRERKRLTYESRGEVLSAEDVDRELTEEYVGKYLFDTVGQIRSAVSKSPKLGLRVRQFLGAVARRIKPDSAVARLILSDVEYARKLWGDAAKSAGAFGESESGAKHSYGDKAYSKKKTRKISLLVDLEGTPKYLLPKYTEWSDFNRTVANETSDLKDGDIRGIIVMTGSNVYSLICDGYMRGIIINKMPFNKIQYTRGVWNNEGTHSKSKNTYGNAEGETVRRLQWSRSNGINDGFREGARAYKLDEDESIGHKTGDSESSSFDDDSINNRFSSLEEALEWLRNYFNENENDTRHSYEDDVNKIIDKWSRESNKTSEEIFGRKAAERSENSPDNGKRKFITSADLAEAGELEPPARSGKRKFITSADLAEAGELEPPARSGERRASSAQTVSGANESYGDGSVSEDEYNASRGEGYVSAAEEYASREESELADMEAARAPTGEYEPRYRGGYRVETGELNESEYKNLLGNSVSEDEYNMSRGEGYVSAAEEYASREERELSDMEAARAPTGEYDPRYRGGYDVKQGEMSESEYESLLGDSVSEDEYNASRGEGYVSAAEEYASREESELADMEAARGTLEERYPDMFKKPEVTNEFEPAEPAPGTARAVGQEAAKKLYGDKVSKKKLAAESERLSDEAFAIKVSDALRAMQEGHILYAGNKEDLQRSLGHVSDLIARTVTEEGISVQEQMLAQDIAAGVKDVTHIPSDWDREQITALAELYAAKDNLEKKNPVSSPLEKLGFHVEYPLVTDYREASSLRGWENARRDAVRIADKLMKNLTKKEKQAAKDIASGLFTIDDYQTAGIYTVGVSLAADALITVQSFNEGGVRAQGASTREAFMKVLNAIVENPEHAQRRSNIELVGRTMVRNNLNVFGDEIGAKLNALMFRPIERNEKAREDFVNREVEEFKKIFMEDGKKHISQEESAWIQLFIEAGIGAEELAGQNPEDLIMRFEEAVDNAAANYSELESDDLFRHSKDKKTKKLIFNVKRTLNENTLKLSTLTDAIEQGLDMKYIMRLAAEADWFRQKYALYYDAINDFLVSHGYRPIGFIKNYAPHMQEDNMAKLSEALSRLGFSEHVFELPVEIAGRTATFKPGKKYNPFFQTRNGTATRLDALEGFGSYVEHLSEVLYHTDDIQKLRLFNQYLRTSMASEEIRKEVNEIRGKIARGEIDMEDGNNEIDKILEEKVNNTNLSPYVTILDEYTNYIAGKQMLADRASESRFGRGSLNMAGTAAKVFIQASIVGNLSSAINQTVQLPLTIAECGMKNVCKAILDTANWRKSSLNKTMDFDKRSVFITGKKGTEQLSKKSLWDKMIDDWGMFCFNIVDNVVSRVIVRSKYYQLTGKGMSSDTALLLSDEFASDLVGSRLKGARPVIFNDKNFFTANITRFQQEIANAWDYISQDIPRNIQKIAKTEGKVEASKHLAALILRELLFAFILNRLLYNLLGQTSVQFDPIGNLLIGVSGGYGMTEDEFVRYVIENKKLPDDFDVPDALKEWVLELVEDLPYVSTITGFVGLTDPRIPIPQIKITNMINGAINMGSDDPEKRDKGAKQLIDGIWSSAKTWVPFGNQINKTVKGIRSVAQGGSYDYSGRLQYPVRNDVKGVIANIPAFLFGTQAFNESGEFWAEGGKALSEDATAAYEALVDTGMDFRDAFDLVKEMSALKGDEKEKPEIDTSGMDPFEAMSALFFSSELGGDDGLQSKVEKQIGLLNSTEGLTGEQKYLAFKHLSASDKVAEMMNYLAGNGADPEIAYGVISELQLVEDTDEEPRARAELLRESELTGWEKSFVYYSSLASKSEREIYDALRELNEGEPVIYETVDAYTTETKKGGKGAAERARAVIMDSDLSDRGKLTMYSMKCVSSSESGEKEQALIDELVAGGADEGEVAEVFSGIKDGEKDTDKVQALLDSDLTNLEIEKVYLQRIVSESSREKTQEKIERVIDAGGNIEIYLEAYIAVSGLSWENGDWEKGESLGKSKAYKKAIDGLTSRTNIRRALYEVFGVSEKLW